MFDFEKTDEFEAWLQAADKNIRQAIVKRIDHAKLGHLGKPLRGTGGISEIVIRTAQGVKEERLW